MISLFTNLKNSPSKQLLVMFFSSALLSCSSSNTIINANEAERVSSQWQSLFNGENLHGWQSYRGGKGGDSNSLAIEDIFTVNNGAIHVYATGGEASKQYNATIVSEATFESFHLKLEYKWGEKRYSPRAKAVRDAGVLFHVHSDIPKVWPPSVEMQMGDGVPGDPYVTGDLWVLGNTRAKAASDPTSTQKKRSTWLLDGPHLLFGEGKNLRRSNRTTLASEKPHGQWNELEVIVKSSESALFYLNGKLLNQISDMQYSLNGEWLPLKEGRIALQAEWAELYYRNIRIKEL